MKKLTDKQRYINLMQKVNKVMINESVFDTDTGKNILYSSFEQFLGNNLNISNTNTTVSADESYVELICFDDEGNEITFNFKAVADESNQDGVFTVGEAELVNFSFSKSDGTDTIEIDESGLQKFNQKYGSQLANIVSQYIDVEDQEPDEEESLYEGDDIYEDAVKKIESMNERRKAWVDGSKAVEVKRECQLGGKGDGTSKACNQGEIGNLKFSKISEKKDSSYPDPMAKDFAGGGDYPKPKKKTRIPKKKIKEEDNFGTPGYSQIRIPQDNIQEFDDDTADTLLGFEPRNVGDEIPHSSGAFIEDGMPGELDRNGNPIPAIDPDFSILGQMSEEEEFEVSTGDRFEDTEGQQYTVNSMSNDKVNIRRNDGEQKEVVPDALKFTKKLNEYGGEEDITLTKELVVEFIFKLTKVKPYILSAVERFVGIEDYNVIDELKEMIANLSSEDIERLLLQLVDDL